MNGICDTCKNDYDNVMQITVGDQTYTFDCFECAIQALAPVCELCQCRVIGHGVQAGGTVYCCANCARRQGHGQLVDRELHGIPSSPAVVPLSTPNSTSTS